MVYEIPDVITKEIIRAALERKPGRALYLPPEPQITAVLGAALIASR